MTKAYTIKNPNNTVNNNVTHDIYVKDNEIVKVVKNVNGEPITQYDWGYMTVKEVEEIAATSGHYSYTFHIDNKEVIDTVRSVKREINEMVKYLDDVTIAPFVATDLSEEYPHEVSIVLYVQGEVYEEFNIENFTDEKRAKRRAKDLSKLF